MSTTRNYRNCAWSWEPKHQLPSRGSMIQSYVLLSCVNTWRSSIGQNSTWIASWSPLLQSSKNIRSENWMASWLNCGSRNVDYLTTIVCQQGCFNWSNSDRWMLLTVSELSMNRRCSFSTRYPSWSCMNSTKNNLSAMPAPESISSWNISILIRVIDFSDKTLPGNDVLHLSSKRGGNSTNTTWWDS